MESPVNKKITISIFSICTISLLAILYLNFKKREIITPDSYKEAMTYVKKIPLSEVQEKINNKEDFILYIGRESCPYCQKFAPKLAVAIQKRIRPFITWITTQRSEKTSQLLHMI